MAISKQVQRRRGNQSEVDAFKGVVGEVVVDTTNSNMRVHDGTAGGNKTLMSKDNLASLASASTARTNIDVYSTAETVAQIEARIQYSGVVYLTSADSPYSVTTADDGKLLMVDASGGAVVLNAPSIATIGEPFRTTVEASDVTNAITWTPDGTDTVGGGASEVIDVVGNRAAFIADVSVTPDNWEVVRSGVPDKETIGADQIKASDAAAIRTKIDVYSKAESADLPGGLIWEHTVSGGAVSSVQSPTLDINSHRSYRLECEFKNATGSSSQLSLYLNNDQTAANYTRVVYSNDGINPLTPTTDNSAIIGNAAGNDYTHMETKLVRGVDGWVSMIVEAVKDVATAMVHQTSAIKKNATVTNVTRVDFVASVANSIADGSTFRIYRG
jgi:hypothetical protein